MQDDSTDPGVEHTLEFRRPEPTVELPAVAQVWQPKRTTLLFVTIAAAGLLSGIGVAWATRPQPAGVVIADTEVGPRGATIVFGRAGSLRVPRGAVEHAVRIKIRRTLLDRIRLQPPGGPLQEERRLVAYTFEPGRTVFRYAATVVLPLRQTKRNGMAFAYVNGSVLFFDGVVSGERGTVTFQVFDLAFKAGRAPGTDR